jgi:hypothetical protein
MNELMSQLHDIEGLDAISSWPLAIGWWVVIGTGILLFWFLVWGLWRWIAYKRSWKHDTLKKLHQLERNLSESTARHTVMMLSEYLRRIVLKRFPRNECASLIGEEWLVWLKQHDPKQFDWQAKGILLIEVPYAPTDHKLSTQPIQELIQATRGWVK